MVGHRSFDSYRRWLVIAGCSLFVLGAGAGAARADQSVTLVFRAAGAAKLKSRYLHRAERSIAKALAKADGVVLADSTAGGASENDPAACSVDPACLVQATGGQAVVRAVGVRVAPIEHHRFELTFLLVDVTSGDELARSRHVLAKRELPNRPGPLLVEFLAAAPPIEQAASPTGSQATSEVGPTESGAGPAQPAAGPTKPWAVGVSPEQEATALAIYKEGNEYFENKQYAQALAKYRKAIQAWDHPAIRFNMAVSLINLGQPVEAYDALLEALKYREAPLGSKLYADGLTYRRLLEGRLARLEVTCKEEGARITLDGQELMVGPGKASRVLLPGPHQVVASKPGFLTRSESIDLISGKAKRLELELITLKAAATTERRWKAWKPWAVVGGGAGLGLLGALLYWRAGADFDSYDSSIASLCVSGCTESEIPGPVSGVETRAKVENGAAIAAFGLGGVALVTGVVLVILNQPHTVPAHNIEVPPPATPASPVTVTPVLGPELTGLAASIRF